MSGRVTQQIVTTVFKPSAEARVTAFVVEVLRTNSGTAPPSGARPQVFLIASG